MFACEENGGGSRWTSRLSNGPYVLGEASIGGVYIDGNRVQATAICQLQFFLSFFFGLVGFG